MRKEFFKAWDKSGLSNLQRKPVSDYCSRLIRVEKVLKLNLDDVPMGKLEKLVLSKIEPEQFKGTTEKVLKDLRSAVTKYWEFREFMRKTFS